MSGLGCGFPAPLQLEVPASDTEHDIICRAEDLTAKKLQTWTPGLGFRGEGSSETMQTYIPESLMCSSEILTPKT